MSYKDHFDKDKYIEELTLKNKELLKIREDLQKKIDNWHIKKKGQQIKIEEYKSFLKVEFCREFHGTMNYLFVYY